MGRHQRIDNYNHDRSQAGFATTMWSMVLSARDRDCGTGEAALGKLCQTYWTPIYGFLRRHGHAPPDAEDLTQGFLSSLLARSSLSSVAPQHGRFRSFLLASLRHYVADQRDYANAAKRGGGRRLLSLDTDSAESCYARQCATNATPETIFERQWADTLFKRAEGRLREECEAAGKSSLFRDLGPSRNEDRELSVADIAEHHRMSENAVRLAGFRLRKRYQEIVTEEIRQTVSCSSELDEEIRHLIGIYASDQ